MYRCAHCKGKHVYAYQAKECAGQHQSSPYQTGYQNLSTTPPPAQPTKPSKKEFALKMLEDIEDGRYAVDPAGGKNYTFIRVVRPKRGRFQGATKVQTQHSDDLVIRLVVWPSGRAQWRMESLVELLLIVAVNKRMAALQYGRELGHCCRCAKTLTDERSRYYGIGPECEQYWPWIITEVDQLAATGELK